VLGLLLPHTAYRNHVSPFVTFFSKVGFGGAGSLMNVVVLTAALSSLNAGLYSTGRILRSMAMNGSGPKFTGVISRNGVPYGGILLTSSIGLLGIVLNAVKPSQAFEIVLHIAAVGVVVAWGTIVAAQLRFYRLTRAGVLQRPSFRMPLAPYSGYLTLVFLVSVVVVMLFDPVQGPWLMGAIVFSVVTLTGGWFLVRNRVLAAAAEFPAA
jgi:L-asparagine permease